MALARGASLAAANARLGAPRTITMPSARISSTEAAGSAHNPDARAARSRERHSRKPAATVALVMTIFVTGFVALALALLFGRDPGTDQPPEVSTNVVAPQAPSPPNTGPPPPSAPAPAPPDAPTPEAPQAPAPSPPQSGDHPHWDDWLHRHLGPDFPVP